MSGYSPAGPPPIEDRSWFQRWRARRRHKKAERKRNWMKLLAGLFVPDKDKFEVIQFIDTTSDDDILCKNGQESWR